MVTDLFVVITCRLWHIITMKFETLLSIVDDDPVFDSGLLLVGDVDPVDARRQLSRWVSTGRLLQLRRGLYALADPYRKTVPHPFHVANRLVRGSYVSLQSALAYAHLIPEQVQTVTSVTTGRPGTRDTPLGGLLFRHIQTSYFFGYRQIDLGDGQQAFVAYPEKALLDLVYLEAGADQPAYLEELRLQRLENLDGERLHGYAERMGKPKLFHALAWIDSAIRTDAAYETL